MAPFSKSFKNTNGLVKLGSNDLYCGKREGISLNKISQNYFRRCLVMDKLVKGKQITAETLKYVNDFDIKELIPDSNFGLGVHLERQLNYWRAIELGESNDTTNSTNIVNLISSVETEGETRNKTSNIDVKEILNGDHSGKLLLLKKELSAKDRLMISRILIDFLTSRETILIKRDFLSISRQICSNFPGENLDYYYTEGCKSKRQSGSLYFRYINSRHKQKKIKSASSHSTSAECAPVHDHKKVDTTITENSKKWLQCNSSPFEAVLEHWQLTFEFRKNKKYQDYTEYFKDWPIIKSVHGSKLLNFEFSWMYPGKDHMLFFKWEEFKLKIVPYFEQNIKDKIYRNMLNSVKGNSSENTINFIIGKLLNTILVPTGRYHAPEAHEKKKRRYTIQQGVDNFVIKVNSVFELNDTVGKLKDEHYKHQFPLQPMIIVLEKENIISEHYVYLDGITYKCSSFVSCLDTCFKIFFTLNLKYPAPCIAAWLFIQKYFYEIDDPNDASEPALNKVSGLLASLRN